MNFLDFLAISTIWDSVVDSVKQSKVPEKNTPAYRRAKYGSIAVVILWIIAIVVIVVL